MQARIMMIDRTKLRREMFSKNINMVQLAALTGLSRSQIYKKISGRILFKEDEIVHLIQLFGACIFFDNILSQIEK